MTALGLPKSCRLLRPAEFKATLSDGKRLHCTGFTVFIRPSTETGARLGLAIAKKHVRFAHERNRLKRLIREHFRLNRAQLPSFDLVFLAKPGVSEMRNELLNDSLLQCFSRIIAHALKTPVKEIPKGDTHA